MAVKKNLTASINIEENKGAVMKTKSIYAYMLIFFQLMSYKVTGTGHFRPDVDSLQAEKVYFAVEINGVLCGYSESTEKKIQKDGKEYLQQDENTFAMLSMLGSKFNLEIKIKSIVDPVTGRCSFLSNYFDQGTAKYNFELYVKGNIATLTSSLNNEPKKLKLSPDVLTGNNEVFYKIRREFIENKQTEVSYDIVEMMEAEIQRSTFKNIGDEKIELAGKTFNAMVIEQVNNKSGAKIKYWLTPEYDYFVKIEMNNRKIYLADRKVVDKIKVANMDSSFFTKTNVSITDVQAISYMKIKAHIEPVGVTIKSENLSIPGQKFIGTVNNNVIEGIFEISHQKYDGEKSPPFQARYENNESLRKYLSAERFIESDDPILVNKAIEITKGSKNSWEAATKLSKWVADNIAYAILGGGTARKTYDILAGECGAHSMLLAAFCRAVGIPARVVWGAMYAPNFNGGFGQHGWNEIYMGDAGWIPVDATAFEHDYVDAGHIRISEFVSTSTSFNGKKIEVLEYKLGDKSNVSTVEEIQNLSSYLGKYTNIEEGRTFTVLEKEGNLSVEVPEQMVLPFNPEDSKGRWQCKIAPHLNLGFNRNENGNITEMVLHQLIKLPKKASAAKIDESIAVEFIPYLGNYLFAAVNAEFTVFVYNGRLAFFDPTRKDTVKLQKPREDGGWLDEYNKNTVYFEKDAKGNVTSMKIDAVNKFLRGELASVMVNDIITKEGLEKGLKKYSELKNANNTEIIFTERSFNLLGYQYLNANKIDEAIEIFKLNTIAYPESFNVYESLGEAFMKNNQNEPAVENYKKALELNPQNDNAVKMLEKLGTK